MKIVKTRTRDEIAALREAAYLAAWPAHKQQEAMQDALLRNKPEKLERMTADFAAIRDRLPYPEESA
ncbi:hypothetical protein [Azospirillum canadense]|uniref:hypothetical protein n=1 Tax=Azospirillum canadense TaxID=403962 RepID=UPI0022260545|nr:hypothetical protein [Azospirillum canadense]MCW2242814.1 hypothetical protein [Azospirillum canadense]MCW2243568.1 hypothetical protein [Azospirillum canadense]